MSFVINTNTLSLTAQSNLNASQKSLNSAIERLSSGSKINSAKDDAAGQAISNRMTSQINGLKQASSNANDGISLAQTTEGALNQVNDNLQRVRELTVQAANGTNSQSDLESIQNEITQRLGEIDRISQQTAFNGTKVLDGSKTAIDIQVGSKDGETITINLAKMDAESLGLDGFSVAGANVDPSQLGSEISNGDPITTGTTGYTIAADSDGFEGSDGNLYQDDNGNYYVSPDGGGHYHNADVSDPSAVAWDSSDGAGPPSGTTTVVSELPVTANVSGLGANQSLQEIQDTNGDGTGEYVIKDTSGTETQYFAATVAADGSVTRSVAGAGPLATLDAALKQVDDLRSDLGAVQNRMDSAINNIDTTQINISSARSRIVDADYATEVSNMSKAQILQQAGTSVLAQANQTSQGVLSLLG